MFCRIIKYGLLLFICSDSSSTVAFIITERRRDYKYDERKAQMAEETRIAAANDEAFARKKQNFSKCIARGRRWS